MNGIPFRCPWPSNDPLMIDYHDKEWGVPVYDDRKLFEFILLDAFQAGLSWKTILYKRAAFSRAFDAFDFEKVAAYDAERIGTLMGDPGIIRNRLKVEAAVKNAAATLRIIEKYGSLSAFLWSFVGSKPCINHWAAVSEVPVSTAVSDRMSLTLKKEGFSFVGTVICYSFMQAAGMVNDHLVHCFRHRELAEQASATL